MALRQGFKGGLIHIRFCPFKAIEFTSNGKAGDSQLIIERSNLPVDPFRLDEFFQPNHRIFGFAGTFSQQFLAGGRHAIELQLLERGDQFTGHDAPPSDGHTGCSWLAAPVAGAGDREPGFL